MFTLALDDQAHLALLEPRHAEAYFALVDAHRAHIATYVRSPARLASVAATREALASRLADYAAGSRIGLGVWHAGELVGEVSARLDERDHGASLGYFLAESAQGRGLVTRACAALIDHLLAERGVHRVELEAAVENQRSRAVAERLGFRLEGVRRGGQFLNGRYVDMALYGLTREDWVAK